MEKNNVQMETSKSFHNYCGCDKNDNTLLCCSIMNDPVQTKKKKKINIMSSFKTNLINSTTMKKEQHKGNKRSILPNVNDNYCEEQEQVYGQKKLKESSSYNTSERMLPPELLLSYTYFLNPEHSCFVTVGYDIESFNIKIIIMKNLTFQQWSFDDWNHLFKNALEIQKFFCCTDNDGHGEDNKGEGNKMLYDNYERKTNTHENSGYYDKCIKFKMIKQNKKRYIIFHNGDHHHSEIKFMKNEWEILYALIEFLNSIISWCNMSWQEIKRYYDAYYEKCIFLQVNKLPFNEFFMMTNAYTYNSSRLFNEVGILCSKKIEHDRRLT